MEPGCLDKKARVLESEVDDKKRVHDLSVDHKGRAPLRASTGVWKASLFVIAMEFSERLGYFGLSTNLIIYLTKVLHQELKTAAKNVNYWSGVTTVIPLLGGFIADAYLGRFSTVLFSSLIYLAGLILLTLSQLVPGLKPPRNLETNHRALRLHEIIFFGAMYSISLATGGHKPSLESFGADQFDDDDAEERKKKMSYFNWWNFGLCCGLLLGVTVVAYIQENLSWGAADIVLTSAMGVSVVIFYLGKPFYRYRVPSGSPLTPILQVWVAAVAKRHLPHPPDAGELHEVPESRKSEKRLLSHTNRLRFLDKAAIIEHKEDESAMAAERLNEWRLATVTQVEEAKLVLAMVPIWLVSLPFGICLAQTTTFFIKQGSAMDRKLSSGLEIPPASMYSLSAMGMIISVCFYDKILVPFLRRATGDERGISILRRIGIGMVFWVLGMIVAAIVERKRLTAALAEQANVASVSVFWLAPQFMILGVGNGFALVGLQEYFYDQVPDNMRSLGIAFYLSVIGASNFLSGLSITAVDYLAKKGGSSGWFARDLNKSRLDLFYWSLAAMSALSFCGYVYLARRYSYKTPQRRYGSTYSPAVDGDVESRIS